MSVVVTIMSVPVAVMEMWGPFYEQPFARSGKGTLGRIEQV